MSDKQSATSSVILRLPHFTLVAPWPIPYAPLTTIFTSPPQCKNQWTLISENTNPSTTSIGQFINLLDTNDKTCLPPGYGRDIWSATFSPGVYCPSGYNIAATGTEVHTAVWEKDLPHSSTERSIVCCLNGFDYTELGDHDACVSAYDHSTTVFTKDYVTESNQFVYTRETGVGAGLAIGHPIHLRHNDQEFKAYFTGIPTDISNPSKSGGLSTGAIAGIAVVCAVVGLSVIGFGIWFILRHRRRKQTQEEKPESPPVEVVYPEPPPPPAAEWASKEPAVAETRKSDRRSRRERGEQSRRHRDRS